MSIEEVLEKYLQISKANGMSKLVYNLNKAKLYAAMEEYAKSTHVCYSCGKETVCLCRKCALDVLRLQETLKYEDE